MQLYIDTSSHDVITIAFEDNGKKMEFSQKVDKHKAQVVLPLIKKGLEKYGKTIKDIKNIHVETKAGSFTGIRVGVTIANALSSALGIPVNNKPIGQLARPQYE